MNASFLEWTQLPADLRARVERLMPLRVVIRQYPSGATEALTEESWSMNWSDHRALVFWSGKAYSLLGEHLLDGVADAQAHCNASVNDACAPKEILVDPCAEDSPIRIDKRILRNDQRELGEGEANVPTEWARSWGRWLNAKTKYDKRNAPFRLNREGALA